VAIYTGAKALSRWPINDESTLTARNLVPYARVISADNFLDHPMYPWKIISFRESLLGSGYPLVPVVLG
jgi:hypothetical protein